MGTTPKNKAIDAKYLLNQLKNLDKNILETKYVQEKDVKDTYTATDENPISGKGVSAVVNTLQQDINGKSNIGHKHTKSEITDFPTSMPPTAHTHDDRYYTESEINTKLNSKLNTSLKGSANGLAELDANGKVPSSQLPSFVDDIIEGYLSGGKFYKESAHTTEITGETGKIYIDLATNKTYRWSGSTFVVVSETLALGETSSTAYRGDRGKIAYDHSQSAHARTDATKVEKSSTNGNIKINGTETTVYTHPSGTNPHGTTKSDVGLGNVGNFKAVSTVANQGLTEAEKSNARANIGAGVSSFSGSYNDLTNKPTIPSVGNGTVTIKQAGTSKGTFTMNQTGNTTIELTDNNTWRGIQNNLTSDSTTDSLSAAQGKVLKGLVDGKAASGHTHNYLPLSGGTITGGLLNIRFSGPGDWNEGIRIHESNNWATITLCGSDNTGDAGTSANTWSIHNNKGNFYITRNGSDSSSSAILSCINNSWSINNNAIIHAGNIGSQSVNYASSAGSAGSVAWGNVTGKPSTFTPASHTHTELMSKNNPTGTGSFSLNRKAGTTVGSYSHAEGYNTEASKDSSHAEGYNTKASGNYSHAEGYYTTASGSSSVCHAEGYKTLASGRYSHAEGGGTNSGGEYSHAEGRDTNATGYCSHTEGCDTDATGYYSHAEGCSSRAKGSCSHAEGQSTQAAGSYSHAEGNYTTASYNAHAEGNNTNAGEFAHAEGAYSTAGVSYSHAEGYYCSACGSSGMNDSNNGHAGAHAGGSHSTAGGRGSFAHGNYVVARENQLVIGHYNKRGSSWKNGTGWYSGQDSGTGTSTAFLIGNGTSSSQSNAMRADYNGKLWCLQAYSATGADYAELFEWKDGNKNNEDRRGYFVTLDGINIKKATSTDDYILGVISAAPTVIGNGDDEWSGRFLRDKFGSFITVKEQEEKIVTDNYIDENGDMQTSDRIVTYEYEHYKENPEYDPNREYVDRIHRPEWDAVGMMGVLIVRQDGTAIVNKYVCSNDEGIATLCEKKECSYRVVEVIDNETIKILIK